MRIKAFRVSGVDSILYSISILVGMGIVFFNNMPAPERTPSVVDSYMEKILTRMDSVSGQLARWESLDVNPYR